MSTENGLQEPLQLGKYTSRKVRNAAEPGGETRDSLAAWIESYLALAVTGVRIEMPQGIRVASLEDQVVEATDQGLLLSSNAVN